MALIRETLVSRDAPIVGMLHRPVKHAGRARLLPSRVRGRTLRLGGTEVLAILRECDQGRRGSVEESLVALPRMCTNHMAKFLGHREGDEKIRARQKSFQLGVEPLSGLVTLTRRAMSIPARAARHMPLAADFALETGTCVARRILKSHRTAVGMHHFRDLPPATQGTASGMDEPEYVPFPHALQEPRRNGFLARFEAGGVKLKAEAFCAEIPVPKREFGCR